jgi:hypothetical protein
MLLHDRGEDEVKEAAVRDGDLSSVLDGLECHQSPAEACRHELTLRDHTAASKGGMTGLRYGGQGGLGAHGDEGQHRDAGEWSQSC